jgi:hypothetical protein
LEFSTRLAVIGNRLALPGIKTLVVDRINH